MQKIKIITDSTCDLPKDIVEKLNIDVIPLEVTLKDKTYKDGIDLDLEEMQKKINDEKVFPTTSQINPAIFENIFKKYLDEGYKIVSMHISSKMSGTYQSACIAKEVLQTDDIIVIDSLLVTSGLGLLVLKAAELVENNVAFENLEEEIKSVIPHVKCVLSFETLENLVRGGRLSKTAGIVGQVLNIRPVLDIRDGELFILEKARGSKKAIKVMTERFESLGIKEGSKCILLNAKNEDTHPALKEMLEDKNINFIEAKVGCVVGTHSGIGACGIFFIEKY